MFTQISSLTIDSRIFLPKVRKVLYNSTTVPIKGPIQVRTTVQKFTIEGVKPDIKGFYGDYVPGVLHLWYVVVPDKSFF